MMSNGNSKLIIPRWVVIEEDGDGFTQCLGVFENSFEAVGCAYSYISDLINENDAVTDTLTPLYDLEDGSLDRCGGTGIDFQYTTRNCTFKGYIRIYFNESVSSEE